MDPNAMMNILGSCGWLDEIPAAERERLEEELKGEGCAEAPETCYEALASLVFDTETIYGVGDDASDDWDSYTKIIRQFGRHSWGQFEPAGIQEVWDEAAETVTVSFEAKGQRFETTVPMQSDWFQEGVYELVNEALEATGVPQRFLLIPVVDQCLYLTFIRPETYEKAKAAKLFPSMAELIAEETGMDVADLEGLA